jgi:hypothetical protein
MSVSSIGPSNPALQAPASKPQVADAPNDGDGDDAAAAPVQAAPSPGTGQTVDKTA